jgi:selenophosphate synthase
VSPDVLQLLHDPQTSGGLLVSIDGRAASAALERLADEGCEAWRIGRVTADQAFRLVVR